MGQCDGDEGGRVKEESADELTTAGSHSGTSFSTNSLLLTIEYKYLTQRSSRLGHIMDSNPAKTVAQLKGIIRQHTQHTVQGTSLFWLYVRCKTTTSSGEILKRKDN